MSLRVAQMIDKDWRFAQRAAQRPQRDPACTPVVLNQIAWLDQPSVVLRSGVVGTTDARSQHQSFDLHFNDHPLLIEGVLNLGGNFFRLAGNLRAHGIQRDFLAGPMEFLLK
jgi:hypothetical protein